MFNAKKFRWYAKHIINDDVEEYLLDEDEHDYPDYIYYDFGTGATYTLQELINMWEETTWCQTGTMREFHRWLRMYVVMGGLAIVATDDIERFRAELELEMEEC